LAPEVIEIFEELKREFSGERAREQVAEIGRFFRSPGSSGYHAAIDFVIDALSAAGVEHRVEEFPLDGRTEIGGQRMPLAWEPHGGSLELVGVEPAMLVRWDECSSCVPWWCPPTPPGGVELELVDVGTGERDEDYVDKDVEGKAVLVHDAGDHFAWFDILARAQRHGAAGVVTNYLLLKFAPWRTRESLPEAVQQLRLRPARENPWAFSVSQPSFERLLAALARGPAIVRFTVDAKTFEGTSRSVLATITGGSLPNESVLFVAHVTSATKPGANCASGVAVVLELARSLQTLIDTGRVARPERSIHFLFVHEELGSIAFAESDPELRRGLLGAFAFCSVGHDQGQTKSALVVGRSPDSLPTFLNELIESLIQMQEGELPWAQYRAGSRDIPYVRWKVLPYTPWSDNTTWSKLGVPGLLFVSLPDRYWHTQLLTVDVIDPLVLAGCGAVAGTAGLVAAQAGWPTAGELMRRVVLCSEAHLNRIALQNGGKLGQMLDAFEYVADRDVASMRSALRLVPAEARETAEELAGRLEEGLRAKAALMRKELLERAGMPSAELAPNGGARIIPRRIPDKPLYGVLVGMSYAEMVNLATEMSRRDPSVLVDSLRLFADELWNLSSGERDLDAIARTIGHEFGFDIDAKDLLQLAKGLERGGYLELSSAN
jgi:hypothetical protein